MERLAWIALGGAVGTLARYGIASFCHQRFEGFPWGTLVVNLVGCFALAVVMELAVAGKVGESVRLALSTGLMGGFTTYSSFNYETTALFQRGAWKTASWNLGATVAGCLLAGLAGAVAGRWLVDRG